MDWDKVRQHLASTTVEERSKVRQAVSERDVEEYLQNYEKTANRVISDSSAKNYVSSAEYTANQSALDALERRRQRALEYLSSNKNAYEDQDKLVAGITDSKNALSGLAKANSSAKDFMSNYKTSRDYEEYIKNLRNKDRLEHLNIKEARDKKYALEQELANLGKGMQSEIGEKGTAAIVSSALSRQNKGQNVYQSMASEETQARRRELEQEINALTQDINLASRIQNTKVQKQMATGAEDFGQYSGIGAQMRDDLIAQREDVYGSHDNFSKSYRNPYVNEQDVKWMTDEETQIYDYYLGKYGQERADQFLESIADEVNYRRAEAIYEGSEDNGAYQALLALASGVDQWAEGTKSAADMILGDGEYRPQSSLQYAAGMTREDLLEVGKLPEWMTDIVGDVSLGSMAFDLAQTSANMLPSIALGHLGGGIVGAASMGLSASGNAYSEMIRNGYDREQATSYAALVGASEAVLEHVLGGITAFGGKLSNKVVAKFLNKVDNALARVAINGVKTGVSEFTEEYLQEILDPVFRNMALNEDNDFELVTEEAIYSGILGALSAGFIEGPGIIKGEVQHQRADKALAEQYSELAGQAIENGLKRPEGTDIRKLAEAAQKRTDKGKTLSGRAMQELVQTEDKAKITEAVENRLKALGESKDIAVVATAIQKKVTDEKLSAKETVALNHSKYGQRILNELDPLNIISESTTSEWTKDIGTTDIRKDFYSRPKETDATEEAKTETAKPVDAVKEAYSKAGIRIGSVGVSSKDTVREVLSNVENIDMDTAEKLAGMYESESGVSANEFIRKTAQAFNIGYLNTPVESARAVLANSSVSSSAMMNAYYLGSNAFAKKHGEQAANSQATAIKGVKGKVIFENGVDRTKLKPQQRVAVETMEKVLADATNIEFHIFESYVKDGKRYYKDEFGVEQEGAPNGKYVGNMHQIWIDINAGGKGEGTMLYTLFHEMTHNIHTWSPEHFKNLTKIVAEAFDKGGYSFEAAVQKKLAQYSKYEDYTRDNCIEEVIAEAMSGIGYDGKVIEDIASRVKAEDETLWQKIVDWLKSIVDRIKKAYAEYPPSAPEARMLMEQKELFEKAQKVFAEAVVESGRAYRKASETVTEGAFKGLEKVTEGDSDIYQTKDGSIIAIAEKGNDRNVKYNIAEYENGGKDILVNWLNSIDKKTKKRIVDEKTAEQIMLSMNYAVDIVKALEKNIPVFKEWGEVGITYDDSGKPVMRCRVKNGDYEINFDFSTVCKKRKGLDAVLNNLIKSGKINLINLSKSDIQFINDTLNKYDFEIACGLCFVDSKRYRVGEWASNAANMYNDIVQSLVKPEDMNKIMDFNFGGDKSKAVIEGDISTWDDSLLDFSTIDNIIATKSNAEGMGYRKAFAKLIKSNPKYRKQLLSSDIISSAGSDRMRNEAGDLLAAVNAVGGTSKPKMSFSESIYDHSVILDKRVDSKTAFAMGGARTQSFSDFIATMFFDYCQMFAEAAGKGLPMQAYTKELSFAKLFGLTGARINLSVLHGVNISAEDRAWLDSMYKYDKDGKLVLNIGTSEKNLERYNKIKENAGLDANGNYVYEQQSIDFDEAVKLQTTNGYSRFLGTIVVGISEKHIWKLLDDIRVRMVIPYHKSGISPVIAKARNIDCYNDFTAHQNTRLGKSWGEDAGKSKNSDKLSSDTKKKIKEIAWDFYSVLHAYEKDWDTKTNSWKAGTKHSSTITYEMASNGVDTFRNDPMRQTCADYLEWCEKNDMIPQFEQFVKHPNYYKVQEDFDVYDCISGEYVPQTPLEFKLPSTENGDAFDAQEVLKTELELQQETSDRLNEKMPEMTKEIIDAIGRKIPPEIKVGKTMMQERDANSGYDGYSMSKRAAEAYRNGEMPISKWTKTAILDAVEEIDPAKATMLKNVPLAVLREKVLSNTSWHHTSAKFNKTDFYSIDEDIIDELTETEIEKWQAKTEAKKAEPVVRKGDFKYIEWAGTKSRPKPIEHNLENVNIETKGSFYIVTDDAGNELVRKKIGSNGTFVEYEEDKLKREEQRKAIEKAIEEKKKTIKANSSAEAFALYTELSEKGYDASYSGNMYHRGRKPAPYYHDNPQDFFKKGEQRLVPNQHGGYTLQTWDGDKWSSESGIRYSERDSEYMEAVNKGNMKTAQKLVDEAVKEVPDIYSEYKTIKGKLTKVPLKVWHYSRTVAEEGAESFTVFKTPAYFSKNKDYASYMFKDGFTPSYEKGEKAKPFYFVSRKMFMMPNIYGRRAFKGEYYISKYPFFEGVLDKDETYIINNFVEDEKIIRTLKDNGYDSLYDKEAGYDCYIVLDANHIFSADPVTYDDNGNVIPLSERFNKANEDIRYSLRATYDKEGMSEKDIEVADEVIKDLRLKSMMARYGVAHTAAYTAERIERELNYSSANRLDYARSYVAWVKPSDFVFATTVSDRNRETLKEEAGTLDVEKLSKESQPIYLIVDFENGRILGHEGRHRMLALEKAGINEVAVIIDARNDDTYNTKPVEYMRLKGQQFSDYEKGANFGIYSMLPLSVRYADVAKELFTQETESGIKYQEREEDLSERGILAKALESAAQGEIEAKNLKNYKKHLAEYDELAVQLHLMKIELDEARKAKDTAKVKELRDKITQTENRLAVFDKRLLKLEAAAPLKALVERERKNAVARADERLSKAIQKQKDKDAEKLDRAMERAKASRQKTIDKLRESGKAKGEEVRRVLRESQEYARADGFLAGQMSQGREDAAKMRRMGEQYEAQIQKGKERLSEQKLKSEQKLLAQAERYRASIKNAAEGRHKTEMRGKIKRKIGHLNALLNGGKERHVPETMRGAVASALDIINMDDERYYTSRLENLRDKLEKAISSAEQRRIAFEIQKIELLQGRFKDSIDKLKASWEEIKQTDEGLYDPLIAEKIDRVSLDIGETLLRDMSMTQLEEVYDLYSMVLKRVQEANKLFDEKRKGEISEQGERIMAEFGGMKKRNKVVSDTKTNIEKFSWNNLKPVYAFMRIGSKVLQERFDAVREGEDVWARDITEAIDFFNKAKEKYNFKKWDKKKTFEFESSAGLKFKLNIEQMMSIYAYSKRKDADKHLLMGGFVFDPRTEAKKGKKHIEDATAYNITAETIQEIASKLTEEQRGYADTMQTYLSEVMGAKGNEVSMKMYDVKLFREKNYFPLKSSKQYMFETDNPAGEIKLKNSGFSKDRIPGANNPIVLSEFTDVWAGHVNDMSMYHAFVLPIDDFTRVYNYKTSMFPNQKSVKGELENVHGVAATAYIKKLLEDINGGARIDSAAGPMNKLISKFKKASVMASLSVVVQQPSSIMRAFAEINPKYLLGLPKMPIVKHNSTWREIKKYAPVAIIKEMGYFDTNMGLSTVDYIKGEKTPMEWIDDKLGFLPGYMDEMTWGAIWHMVKRETKAKHPTMKVSSDEFLNLCGERFTDIVVKTQVYDSVLSRSANMRSPDGLVKMATAFMAEPTTSINMLGEAVRAGKRKNPARTAAITTSVISSVMLNSALASLVYAIRDDAEDETFWEKYIKNFNKEMVDGLNPLTYIPLVKDAVSILQGWDVKRSDMDLIDKLHTKTMTLIDLIFTETDDMSEEEKKEYYRQLNWAIAETGGAVADLFGIPGKNIVREIKGGLNTYHMIERQANEDTKLVTTKTSLGHSLEASAIDILPDALLKPLEKLGLLKDKDVQDKIYDAVMAGDTEYIDRLRKGFDSDKEFNKQLRWGLRDNDERIEEAVIARHEGRFTEYENLIKDIVADGFDRQNVITAIEAETFAMFPEEEEESGETIKGMYNAEDFLTAYNKKNTTAMNSIRADIIKTYVAKGKTEDEAESKFHSAIYAATREEYEKGNISANAAKTILEQHSGRTEQKADAAITLWDYQSKYPNDDVEIYWIYDYHDHIQDSGMGLKDYVDYRNDAKLCKGEDKNGDGRTDSGSVKKQKLLLIDALPITNEQKDAIYLAEGWPKNTMWEAPWR